MGVGGWDGRGRDAGRDVGVGGLGVGHGIWRFDTSLIVYTLCPIRILVCVGRVSRAGCAGCWPGGEKLVVGLAVTCCVAAGLGLKDYVVVVIFVFLVVNRLSLAMNCDMRFANRVSSASSSAPSTAPQQHHMATATSRRLTAP